MEKRISITLCTLLFTSLLAGCGNTETKNSSGSAPVASAAATAASTNKTDKNEKPVTISFMHFKSDVTDGVQKIVDQFEKENPNIKVEVQPVKYDDYYTLLKTKVASGDVIDVFSLNSGSNTKSIVDGGYLLDLTDQPFMKNFEPSVLKDQATDGKNYIMPLNSGPIAVFYNKKIFKELGLEIPKTWDALMAAAKKIKDSGKTPFALGWKDGWPLAMWDTRDLPSNTALIANQPDFFEKIEKGQAKFADNPAVKVTIDHAKQYFEYGNKDQLGVDYNGAVDLFAKGDAAMMYMGTWPLQDIEKKNPDLYKNDVGYFPYPFSNDASKNKLEFNPDASLAVSSKTEHKEAALKFLAFMGSKAGGDAWVNNVKSLSYVKGSSTNIAPAVDELKPYIEAGNIYNSQAYLAKTTIDWGGQFSQDLQKYFFNKMTADEIIKDMDDWVQKNHK
ncbi:carbohydrate ABC transporter substrate-binding protein, CUT1 family (TC 3.A.1.1.-) [Paenibacillus sp. yr247]|uniref:ABC transporter substrate-binding protein n=1 Tax=Paenibacillus sp. yr247 TaxID=1761880 RepID=UPI0008825010|nr:extracellular solute-binding protein [Paenibacillus sp. yr247]SDN93364.1 carbohydrate ABC transporter substrate-binding protein, CUT1 family (TC 3.A.1.1.-) [Paenibacillus sp. yr247]